MLSLILKFNNLLVIYINIQGAQKSIKQFKAQYKIKKNVIQECVWTKMLFKMKRFLKVNKNK